MREAIVRDACAKVPSLCTRTRARFFTQPIEIDGKALGVLEIYDGDGEAVDVVHAFCEAAERR